MSQPVMTVWEVMEDHKHLDAHNVIVHPNLISCNDEQYTTSVGPSSLFWSITNEGDQDLVLGLPLSITGATGRFEIKSQPDEVIPPGQESIFEIEYSGLESFEVGSLVISSNISNSINCTYTLNAGPAICGPISNFTFF